MSEAGPRIEVFNHCGDGGAHGRTVDCLEKFAAPAVREVLRCPGPHERVLPELPVVEVNLVDDRSIADVHRRFMADESATDVITFPHGEVFISVETAARRGPEFGHDTQREALLYLIHALLHLDGHEDHNPEERAVMGARQEAILSALWPA